VSWGACECTLVAVILLHTRWCANIGSLESFPCRRALSLARLLLTSVVTIIVSDKTVVAADARAVVWWRQCGICVMRLGCCCCCCCYCRCALFQQQQTGWLARPPGRPPARLLSPPPLMGQFLRQRWHRLTGVRWRQRRDACGMLARRGRNDDVEDASVTCQCRAWRPAGADCLHTRTLLSFIDGWYIVVNRRRASVTLAAAVAHFHTRPCRRDYVFIFTHLYLGAWYITVLQPGNFNGWMIKYCD